MCPKVLEFTMSTLNNAINHNAQLKNLENTLNELSQVQANENKEVTPIEQKCKDLISKKLFNKIVYLDPLLITVEDNCRTTMDTDSVSFFQLLSSIKKEGILQNIVVEVREKPWRIICIAGQRRLIAAQQLTLEKIPCLVKEFSNKIDSVLKSLDENIHRENLMPIELAEAYVELEKCGLSIPNIADRYEKDEKTIRRYLKLGAFPKAARDIIRAHPEKFIARVLYLEFAQRKWANDLEIINAVKQKVNTNNEKNVKPKVNNEYAKLFTEKFGLKSELKESGAKGKFTIAYTNEDEKNKLFYLLEKLA